MNVTQENLNYLQIVSKMYSELLNTINDLISLSIYDNLKLNDLYFYSNSRISLTLINDINDDYLPNVLNVKIKYDSYDKTFIMYGDNIDILEFNNMAEMLKTFIELCHEKLELSQTI